MRITRPILAAVPPILLAACADTPGAPGPDVILAPTAVTASHDAVVDRPLRGACNTAFTVLPPDATQPPNVVRLGQARCPRDSTRIDPPLPCSSVVLLPPG